MLLGAVPIGVALGLAGALAIWFGGQSIMAMPTNVYTGIAKYPLIAIPMFVLVGSVFDRTGVALRLVRFATALVGGGPGRARHRGDDRSRWSSAAFRARGPRPRPPLAASSRAAMVKDGYPRPFIAERRRRGGRHRHSHPALDRVHHLRGDDAGGVGAGDLRGRHVPGHPRRPDDADPHRGDFDHQGLRRQVEGSGEACISGRPSRKRSGACWRRS